MKEDDVLHTFWRWIGAVLTVVVAAGVIGIWNMSINVGKMQTRQENMNGRLGKIEMKVDKVDDRVRNLETRN